MPSTFQRRALHLAPIAGALVFLLSDARPARAAVSCFQDLRACYYRSAMADSYWAMWSMGMDCELGVTDCVRRALIGR